MSNNDSNQPISSAELVQQMFARGGSEKSDVETIEAYETPSLEELVAPSEQGEVSKDTDSEQQQSEGAVDIKGQEDTGEETGESSSKSSEDATEGSENAESKSQVEKIVVSDGKGRREIEVDFSDKEALTKYIQMGYGARKWQAEKDQAVQKMSETQEKLREYEQNFKVLDDALNREGIEGVIDVLMNKKGAHKEWLEQQRQREEFLKHASPEQVEALELREKAEKEMREIERERKANKEFREKVERDLAEAEKKAAESLVNPIYNKYRFAGKLGSEEDEAFWDEILYSRASQALESGEGSEVSEEDIEAAFKKVSDSIRKRINTQADKTASKILKDTKKKATESVQSTVRQNYTPDSKAKQEAAELLKNRDYGSLFAAFKKFGPHFNQK